MSFSEPIDREPRARLLLRRGSRQSEWLLASLLVGCALFSALAFWESTRYSALSTDLTNQARLIESSDAKWFSFLQTKIAHDRRAGLGCEAAIRHRDALLREYAHTFSEATRARIVEAEQTRVALASQMIGAGAFCPGYDVSSTMEQEAFWRQDQDDAGTSQLLYERARLFDVTENIAVGSTVVFAAALFVLALADNSKVERRYRYLLVLSMILVLAGLSMMAAAATRSGLLSRALVVIVAVASVGLAGLAWALTHQEISPWRERLGMNKPVSWWAELLGALTLVLLTVAILGASTASIAERQTAARADLLESDSKRALEIGQISALSVLGIIQEISKADALITAAATGPAQNTTGSSSAGTLRESLLQDMWPVEEELWEALLAEHQKARTQAANRPTAEAPLGCLREELILPWRSDMVRSIESLDGGNLPEQTMAASRGDVNAYWSLIVQSATGASVCSAQVAVHVDTASEYGGQASKYTTAIIALGVAGFLFAFAADNDRSRDTRHWLLAAAAVGLVAGSIVLTDAWRSAPGLVSDKVVAEGTVAYAQAETATAIGRCDDARRFAGEAVSRLPDFAPAHVAQARSYLCDEGTLFIKAKEADEKLDGYLASLETAVDELGSESSLARGSLGWALILRHLRGEGPDSTADLARAETLTLKALQGYPSNPFACFNWAFTSLIRGDLEEATSRYRHALDRLEGEEEGEGPCQPVNFEGQDLRALVRLHALADLELLADTEANDQVRALIVGADEPPSDVEVSGDGFTMQLSQTGISLTADQGGPDSTTPLSVVWYYRSDPSDVWAVIRYPTLWSLEPGTGYLGFWERLGLMPDGQYRVDVYTGGMVTHRIDVTSDEWDSYALAPSDFRPVNIRDLGVAAAVPADWTLLSVVPGIEVVYGGHDGRVAFMRLEGSTNEDLQATLDTWTTANLEHWGQPPLGEDEAGLNDGDWYMGLNQTLTAETRTGLLRGAGHSQYVVASEAGVLSDETIRKPTCPGMSLMTLIYAEDPNVAETIWESMSITSAPLTVALQEVGLTDSFVTSDFSVAIPDGWHAMGCPLYFVAQEGDARANFLISTEVTDEALTDYVLRSIDNMVAEFPGFALDSRQQFQLANGVDGERIDYTWDADGVGVDQTQIYVPSSGRIYILTFTTTLAESAEFTNELEAILGSYLVGEGPKSIVVASCTGCTAAETRDRQRHLDEIAEFIYVVDTECRDATEEIGTTALARITCSFPGGFGVTYSLWPDAATMEAVLVPLRALEGADVQPWDMFGDFEEPDGSTVEWVEDGAARFFWTYDERLISGDARLDGGDQQRLSNWWQTAGALIRE